MDVVSIIILGLIIVIGFLRKVNVGILAIFAATVFGVACGVSSKEIIKGFGSNLFITLLGITFLCSFAQSNGALELFAKKCVSKIGKNTWLAPVVVWILGIILSGVGPGSIPTLGIVCAVAMPVAYATGYDPIMMGVIGEIGIFCGRFSPVTSDSAVIGGCAAEQGLAGYEASLFIYALITSAVLALVMFFAFKGHKVKPNKDVVVGEKVTFNKAQTATLLGFVVAVILTVGFNWNIGLSSFCVMSALTLMGFVDEKQAIKSIPWGVLLMVSGVGILMNLVIQEGGIDLITNALGGIMTEKTAAGLVGATAGIMSWFSSATGVVYPTMIPTVSGLVDQIGTANPTQTAHTLISMIAMCAAYAGLSPASTGGGLILATRAALDSDFTKEQENKAFVKLFGASAACLAIIVIFAFLGAYSFL